MDSVRRPQHSDEMNSETILRRTITLIALVLVVYLPLETGLIGGLPFTAYWVLRLLPDAVIAVAAVASCSSVIPERGVLRFVSCG